jgi:hypothetical protein
VDGGPTAVAGGLGRGGREEAGRGGRAMVEAVLGDAWRRAGAGMAGAGRVTGGGGPGRPGDGRRWRRAISRGGPMWGGLTAVAEEVGVQRFRSRHCGMCGRRGK